MENKVELAVDSKTALDALIWAKQNCPNYVTNYGYDGDDSDVYIFCFANEHEANWFRLRWL